MKAIIWAEPTYTSEVLQIQLLPEEIIFHLENGLALRVGEAPQKIQAELNQTPGTPGINLFAPPFTQTDIFYKPLMPRSVYGAVWPILATHSDLRKAFRGHPKLESVAQLSYDALGQLPLEAYISGPFGLYLGHPFNFTAHPPASALPETVNDYTCDFRDAAYLVKVSINLQTKAVRIAI
jgi:hypothetical protein